MTAHFPSHGVLCSWRPWPACSCAGRAAARPGAQDRQVPRDPTERPRWAAGPAEPRAGLADRDGHRRAAPEGVHRPGRPSGRPSPAGLPGRLVAAGRQAVRALRPDLGPGVLLPQRVPRQADPGREARSAPAEPRPAPPPRAQGAPAVRLRERHERQVRPQAGVDSQAHRAAPAGPPEERRRDLRAPGGFHRGLGRMAQRHPRPAGRLRLAGGGGQAAPGGPARGSDAAGPGAQVQAACVEPADPRRVPGGQPENGLREDSGRSDRLSQRWLPGRAEPRRHLARSRRSSAIRAIRSTTT